MSANSHPPNSKNVLCNAAAGAAAGVVAATFVCPLDVIKTRFQVHGLPKLGDANIKGLSFFFPFKSSQKLDSVADVIVSGF
jgi:solute carrier family 25 folate transporter 32